MIRLFLAITPPPPVRKDLTKEITHLKKQIPRGQINWVKPENLHITLIFLGWVKEGQEKIVKRESAEALKEAKRFGVTVEELSYRGHPLWLEVSQGKQELVSLQRKILLHLSFKGPQDLRPFHPHLTLGRIKKRGKSKLNTNQKRFSWEVQEVILYQSQLKRTGSAYKALATFPLKG